MSDSEKELVALTQKLLDSISAGDWVTYADLCDPSLTAIEAEAPGQVVVGLDFHKFYFDLGGVRGRHRTTMSNTAVRLMGDAAVVTYARLVQRRRRRQACHLDGHGDARLAKARGPVAARPLPPHADVKELATDEHR